MYGIDLLWLMMKERGAIQQSTTVVGGEIGPTVYTWPEEPVDMHGTWTQEFRQEMPDHMENKDSIEQLRKNLSGLGISSRVSISYKGSTAKVSVHVWS